MLVGVKLGSFIAVNIELKIKQLLLDLLLDPARPHFISTWI